MLPTLEGFQSFRNFLGLFGQTTFYGIPMDLLAHFFVGCWLTYILQSLKVSIKNCYIIVFGLCLFKEGVFDLTATINSGLYWEPLKDTISTLAGAFFAEIYYLTTRVEASEKFVSKTPRG